MQANPGKYLKEVLLRKDQRIGVVIGAVYRLEVQDFIKFYFV